MVLVVVGLRGYFIVDSGGTDRYTLSTLLGFFPAGPEKSGEGSRSWLLLEKLPD